MYFYVGACALKELNDHYRTDILNENGESLGAFLGVSRDGTDPYISNLFGTNEYINLDELELENDDHFTCLLTTAGEEICFALYILKPTKVGLKTRWTRE